ncbi:MAG: hypothetical protein IKK52_07115 [Alphaproteobacteria bacterium]|nr:hypothetical protein [Alphaproteobacteria bacterium]
MKKILSGLLMLMSISVASAQDNMLQMENQEQYFQENNQNPDKSIIYIFFNNQPCPTCPAAMDMIEEVYNQNFLNDYSLFMINYGEDNNAGFVQSYNLSEPLEVVMVYVNDGQFQGYQKIEGLQDMTSAPQAFDEYFVSQVNGYLGE